MVYVRTSKRAAAMSDEDQIRTIIGRVELLSAIASTIGENEDLFEKGLDSFGSVQLMLALEDHFNIEFPDHLLNRRSFSTIRIIRDTVATLTHESAA